MKGVVVIKAKLVSDDSRRKILEIINGQLAVKNLKVLYVKSNEVLGNHWHPYAEVMFILKGKANYKMMNVDTREIEDFNLEEGDVIFRTARIVHGGRFEKGSIIIDGACEVYINSDFNDIKEVIIGGE